MLYQPQKPKRMWDCTLYYEALNYHIFFLSNGNIGHVTTSDFIHYKEYPDIIGFGKKGSWNENGVPLTGTLVKDNNVYKMLLGAIEPETFRQVYGLYLSDDLIHWEEYDQNPVLVSDGVIYDKEVSPRDGCMYTAWRDPNVVTKENGYYTLCLCARLKQHSPDSTGAAVAKLKTKDFIRFEYCEPFSEVGTLTKYAECPDCFELDGNRYLLFLDHSWGGLRTHTATRMDPAGTFYQIFDTKQNQFIFPQDSLLLGSGNNRQCAWAARTVLGKDNKRLLYYHVTADFPSFGIPKEIGVKKDKSLYLKYFSEMNHLYGKSVPIVPRPLQEDDGHWETSKNNISGEIGIYGSALPIAEGENFIADCTITLGSCDKAGIACWHSDKEETGAATVWLDYKNQRIMAEWEHFRAFEGFGDFQNDVVNGGMLRERDEKSLILKRNTPYVLKIIARNSTLDVYLNDEWVLCKRFPMCSGKHKISLLVERGKANFLSTEIHECEEIHID